MQKFTNLDANLQPLPADADKSLIAAIRINATGLQIAALNVGGKELNHADAVKACAELNHAGVTGWRLPEIHELLQIVDYTRFDPAVDPLFAHFVKPDWYWSATAWARNASSVAWYVYFSLGASHTCSRYGECFVLAVRSGGMPGQ